jgi:aarF domain-containing kinase
VVENVATVIKFLTGGSSAALSAGRLDPAMVRDLLPFLPSVATQILPELSSRLFSRITARFVREVFI